MEKDGVYFFVSSERVVVLYFSFYIQIYTYVRVEYLERNGIASFLMIDMETDFFPFWIVYCGVKKIPFL